MVVSATPCTSASARWVRSRSTRRAPSTSRSTCEMRRASSCSCRSLAVGDQLPHGRRRLPQAASRPARVGGGRTVARGRLEMRGAAGRSPASSRRSSASSARDRHRGRRSGRRRRWRSDGLRAAPVRTVRPSAPYFDLDVGDRRGHRQHQHRRGGQTPGRRHRPGRRRARPAPRRRGRSGTRGRAPAAPTRTSRVRVPRRPFSSPRHSAHVSRCASIARRSAGSTSS